MSFIKIYLRSYSPPQTVIINLLSFFYKYKYSITVRDLFFDGFISNLLIKG